jgi:hypothetical protein
MYFDQPSVAHKASAIINHLAIDGLRSYHFFQREKIVCLFHTKYNEKVRFVKIFVRIYPDKKIWKKICNH